MTSEERAELRALCEQLREWSDGPHTASLCEEAASALLRLLDALEQRGRLLVEMRDDAATPPHFREYIARLP